jgi:hypothetical protein
MGGLGSGNFRGSRTTVESCLPLSISEFKEELRGGKRVTGRLVWSNGDAVGFEILQGYSGLAVRLAYTSDGVDCTYSIPITATRPNFGGRRFWFLCPGQGCGRRVGKLYKPRWGRYWLCRHCYNLTYRSSQMSGRPLPLWQQLGVRELDKVWLLGPFLRS